MTYSMCCQRPSMPPRLPTFVLPDTAPTVGSASGRTRRRDGLRLEDGVAVDHHDDLRLGGEHAGGQGGSLAAVGSSDHAHAG